MDTKNQVAGPFQLCNYEWLSLVTVTATVMALAVVAWLALDPEADKLPPEKELIRFSVVEK